MAVEHQHLPIAAAQFHPELVMTLQAEIGLPIIASVMSALGAGVELLQPGHDLFAK